MLPSLRSHKEYIQFVQQNLDSKSIPKVHSNPYGKKVCNCQGKSSYHCECKRFYNAKDASLGYDSYRDCYVFGYNLYQINSWSFDNKAELPSYLMMVTAARHDSVSGMYACHRAIKGMGYHVDNASYAFHAIFLPSILIFSIFSLLSFRFHPSYCNFVAPPPTFCDSSFVDLWNVGWAEERNPTNDDAQLINGIGIIVFRNMRKINSKQKSPNEMRLMIYLCFM